MNLQTAPKLRIVNSADQFVIKRSALKANGAYQLITVTGVPATDAGATDKLNIVGFAELLTGKVTSAIKTLAIPGQKQTSTLTVTLPALVAGKVLSLKLITKTNNLEHEFVRFDGHNQKDRTYDIVLKTGDTVTTVAARIAEIITYDEFSDAYKFVTATSAVGVVTVIGESEGWEFEFIASGDAIDGGHVAIAQAVTAPSFEGRNVYRQLNTKRLENGNRSYPYAAGHYVAANEVPVAGGMYTSFIINFLVERTDLSGPSVVNQSPTTATAAIELFILNGSADANVTILTDWLIANATKFEQYTATTAAAAIVAETPTLTTV